MFCGFFHKARLGAVYSVVGWFHNHRQNFFQDGIIIFTIWSGERLPAAEHQKTDSRFDFFGEQVQVVGREVFGWIIAYDDGLIIIVEKRAAEAAVGGQIIEADIVKGHNTRQVGSGPSDFGVT